MPSARLRIARTHVATCAFVLGALLAASRSAGAQGTDAAPAARLDARVQSAIDRARALHSAGKDTVARTLLDSLARSTENGSDEYAEAVYWRAVIADRAADAERDWKRLTVETPLSPRAPDALLWLAELEMVRGHPAVARAYLERILLEHASAPHRPKASVWIARTYFDERDFTRACEAVTIMRRSPLPDGEIRLQGVELQNRCAAIASAAVAAADTTRPVSGTAVTAGAGTTPSATSSTASSDTKRPATRYAIQLAAFNTRAEATALVKKMATRNVTARVDGERKPYRVRTGRYETESQARTSLAALKKRGITGILVEITP
jgi:cell division septation protein DedD